MKEKVKKTRGSQIGTDPEIISARVFPFSEKQENRLSDVLEDSIASPLHSTFNQFNFISSQLFTLILFTNHFVFDLVTDNSIFQLILNRKCSILIL